MKTHQRIRATHQGDPRPLTVLGLLIIRLTKRVWRTSKFNIAQEWATDACRTIREPFYVEDAKRWDYPPSLIESFERVKAAPTHAAMRQAARIMLAEVGLTSRVFDDDGNMIIPTGRGVAPFDPNQRPRHLRLVHPPQPGDPGDPDPAPKPQPQPKARFTFQRFADIKLSTARNYLIKGLLPRRGLAVIWGPPKCGKSFIAFDMAMHIALGQDYRGCRVQQGSVVYLALEGGSGFPARKAAWEMRNLGDHVDPADVPFHLLHDASVDLINEHDALIACIREQIPERPAVVFVDTLNRALNGDENASKDMGNFIRAADAITAAFECLTVVIHHCGIVGSRPRGHTSLSGADDAQIAVEKDKNEIITATIDHMKDSPARAPFASRLEVVELGTRRRRRPAQVLRHRGSGNRRQGTEAQQGRKARLRRADAVAQERGRGGTGRAGATGGFKGGEASGLARGILQGLSG